MTSPYLVSSLIQFLDEETLTTKLTQSKNEVHRLILDNEMNVLLIHNSAFKNSEAMLTVDAGSIYDPDGIPGLAQLVEHLVLNKSENEDSNMNCSKIFINYQNKTGGMFNSATDSEKITFYLRNFDFRFRSVLNLFSNAIANPTFTNSLCFKEIEFIENEVNKCNQDAKIKVLELIKFFSDDKTRETRSIVGSKKTLNIDNIAKKAQEFYSKYFKANRMKLVIKSKLPLEKLKKYTKLFEDIPNDAQTSNTFHIQKKEKKNPSYYILDHSVDTKLKEEYKGKIIKFHDINFNSFVYFYFRFPSSFEGLTSIHLDYIEDSISQHLKEDFNQTNFFKNIQAFHQISRRKKEFFIVAECNQENDEVINFFISFIYKFINGLRADRTFFEEVKNRAIAKYEQNIDHSNMLQTYSDHLFLHSAYKLGEFEKSVEFDEKVFEDLFKIFADINNWIVFISTTDPNLQKSIPDFPCAFSDPVPIKIETLIQGFFMNSNQIKNKKICDVTVNYESSYLNFPKNNALLVYQAKLSNGEYIILRDRNSSEKICEVILTFISPAKKFNNFSNELFYQALIKRIEKICSEDKIDCELKIICCSSFDNNLSVKLENTDLTKFFTILKDLLESYKVTRSEIADAKSTIMQNYIKVKELGLSNALKYRLPYVIKQVDFNFEIDDNYPIQFNENYYLVITAAGRILKKEIVEIYEELKSTGEREIFDELNFKSFCISSPHPIDNSFIISYHLAAESKIKEFALANLLKEIFSFYLSDLINEKFGFWFELEIDYTYVRQKAFLTFAIKTLANSTLIKEELIKAIKSYSEIINKISVKNLDVFKESAFKIFKWKMYGEKRLSSLALLMTLTGIYDKNFQALVIESLYSIDIEELKSLQNYFSVEPFLLNGSNEVHNKI